MPEFSFCPHVSLHKYRQRFIMEVTDHADVLNFSGDDGDGKISAVEDRV